MKPNPRRHPVIALPLSATLFATLFAIFAAAPAQAQSYPNKPVRFVVPLVPGGPTDIQIRHADVGAQVIDGTPEQFHAYLKAALAKFEKLVKAAGIKAASGG